VGACAPTYSTHSRDQSSDRQNAAFVLQTISSLSGSHLDELQAQERFETPVQGSNMRNVQVNI
jgi:hypothetical protein